MTAHFLAIDQGGHASRAILFDAAGRKIDEAFAEIATQRQGEQVEHDPEELLASIRGAVEAVSRRAAAGGLHLQAAGLATQRSSMICWHRHSGEALSPVISWADRRNARWLEQLEPRREWIRRRTGLVLTPHYGASKMRWCLDHLPAVQRAARAGELAMGPLSSFILFRLLPGRPFLADPANASRTQLWDPARGDWSDDLLQLYGIPREALPRCVTSRHDYGSLPTVAGALALTVATGDQSAVPFAFGKLDAAAAYINVGTGAFVQRSIHDRLPEAPRLLASVVWSDEAGVDYMIEGTVNGAGSALSWFGTEAGIDAEALLARLETSAAALLPPVFLNGIGGLGSPYWAGGLEPRFVPGPGTTGDAGVEERLLAVMESILFMIRVNLEELDAVGLPLQRLVLTGGLTASNLFCQRLADLTGLPAWRSRETEATARGLARLLAGSAAAWPAPAGDEFRPRTDAALQSRFTVWQQELRRALDTALH